MASAAPPSIKGEKHELTTALSKEDGYDDDATRLAEMGYTQELNRKFSIWSLIAVSFALTNSWFGLSTALITGINSGGPVLLIYGLILMGLISAAVGVSLGEMASAYPNSGGQYFWAKQIASPRYAPIASYLTGWFSYLGAVFTSASISLAMGSAVVGLYQLTHPDFTIQPWHVVVAYQFVNLLGFTGNVWGRALPWINTWGLYTTLCSFFIILIAVTASAPSYRDAKFVFTDYINNTGWRPDGVAFILGLINANWPFAALDCATHLAEEVAHPERRIPLAIMVTVALGFGTSWIFVIGMLFSLQDITTIGSTPTLVPSIEIFNQAINRAGAIGLESLIILTGIGCQIACHTWQTRLAWSFARDGGLPGYKYLSHVDLKLDVPFRALVVSCFLDALIGLLYLGSTAAFNSVITAAITALYVSYSIPVIAMLAKGRNNMPKGPFWCGSLGLVCNIVLLLWTVFTLVAYSLPTVRPVTPTNMNYVSAVYAGMALVVGVDWFARGRKTFVGHHNTQ